MTSLFDMLNIQDLTLRAYLYNRQLDSLSSLAKCFLTAEAFLWSSQLEGGLPQIPAERSLAMSLT